MNYRKQRYYFVLLALENSVDSYVTLIIRVYDIEDVTLKNSFEKLLSWAHNYLFPTSWKNVFFVKATSIRCHLENDFSRGEVPREALFTFEEFEKYFDETLLNQGHSWINLQFWDFWKII